MSDYRLEALLRLRQRAVGEARRDLGAAVAAVEAAERDHRHRSAEIEALRLRGGRSLAGESGESLRRASHFRMAGRSLAWALQAGLERQRRRLQDAEAGMQAAARGLASARAEEEVLESHRRRWLAGRRVAREAADEREAETWVLNRSTAAGRRAGSRL